MVYYWIGYCCGKLGFKFVGNYMRYYVDCVLIFLDGWLRGIFGDIKCFDFELRNFIGFYRMFLVERYRF